MYAWLLNTITFESPDVYRKFIFGLRGYLQETRVNFAYEGYRVKVKATAAKKREIPYFRDVKLRLAISPVL